jgi:hypothetical protein
MNLPEKDGYLYGSRGFYALSINILTYEEVTTIGFSLKVESAFCQTLSKDERSLLHMPSLKIIKNNPFNKKLRGK